MANEHTGQQASILYIPHGGGPLPLLADPEHGALVRFLQGAGRLFGRPDAIVLISAHWEERIATVTGHARPPLMYDYSGFPEEAYRIRYAAPGAPALAARVIELLRAASQDARLDEQRGFDHGLFVPLKLIYPEGGIPCIQVSLLASLDPRAHVLLGRALAPLRRENILVVGSGFSFHNMRAFFTVNRQAPDEDNERFSDGLIAACTDPQLASAAREERLIAWESIPGARHCHPRPEHLLPLHVCQGAAQRHAQLVFDNAVLGKRALAFLWSA